MGAVVVTLVPVPAFRVSYGAGDVTAAIDDFLVRLDFTDNLHGKADEIQIQVEDTSGAFTGEFWPKKGDDLNVSIGWNGGELDGLWPCGYFVIDEAQADGPPDTVTIKALSSSIKKPVRQRNSRAFEGQTIKQIADKIAAENGMSILGELPEILITRATQHKETDLGFLARLASEYGCICKANGDAALIMHSLDDLLSRQCEALIDRTNIIRYSFRSKTADAPRAHVARYFNPATKQLLGGTVPDRLAIPLASTPAPGAIGLFNRSWIGGDKAGRMDVGKWFERLEDQAQADARITARLMKATLGQVEGSITIPGDPRMRAGMNAYLDGFGVLTGPYLVTMARHSLTRGGYTTELDLSVNPKLPSEPIRKK